MNKELQTGKVLIIEDNTASASQVMTKALDRLEKALADKSIFAERVASCKEACPLVETDMDIDCFLISGNIHGESPENSLLRKILCRIRCRRNSVPVFLMADREPASGKISEKLMEEANEFAWIFEDSPVFLAGRIEGAIRRYREQLLPPLMKAVWEYNEKNHEYSWAAPGHQGGIGFTKNPAGKKFYDFYGENLFRTDTGIERASIGSLLDHEGAFGESERYAAKVFGAHESYSVITGTSGSNRTILQSCLSEGDLALCDRNCHKSIEQGLILTGAIPIYMVPSRNRYGIIGPVSRKEMTPEAIAEKLRKNPLKRNSELPDYAVVTNCTYDGICYHAGKVEETLGKSCSRIHFDEAWYAYAKFHPVYENHYAMRGDAACHSKESPTVFATHSTHKLLNALSQASYIHIRQGRNPLDFDHINQAYMMQTTTSPLYAICVSNDIAAAMMHHSGRVLMEDVIAEAVDFRQALARIHGDFLKKGEWFFKPWNAEHVICPKTGKSHLFAEAPRELLITRQECWRMEEGETWHGFCGLEKDYVMLDPIKVSILAPGMGDDGKLLSSGVPAALVSAFLYKEGIVPTRTTDFQLMFLFSMGITKGKWGTLLNALLNFKELYDTNAPLGEVLPELTEKYPEVYGNTGLHCLAEKMFDFLVREEPDKALNAAFDELPGIRMSPREAYREIVKNQVEFVSSENLAGRIAANSVIPYPPGIPMLMSGEMFGREKSPQIAYLHALEKWDRLFPGFEHVTEGTKVIDGKYCVLCVK